MSRTYKLDAAKYRRLTDAAGMIGDDAAELVEYLGLSEREALWVHILVVCALAEMMSNRPLALEMIRINWPDLFERKPEPPEWCPSGSMAFGEPYAELSDAEYVQIVLLVNELLEIIHRHPDGDFPGETSKRIRAIGERIYRIGSTLDLLTTRTVVEHRAGQEMRKRLDRIWYSDLERIPFDDHDGYFKELS